MKSFESDKDLNVTPEGRAKDRIPNDLALVATQEGTILNAVWVNGVTFEIENLTKAMGITPERGKEDQLAKGINDRFIYDYVARISSWDCESDFLPRCEIPLLGGKLNPTDFEDELAELQNRCPTWVQGDGSVLVPDYSGYFPRFDMSRTLGNKQEDAMRQSTLSIKSSIKVPKMPEITIPGELSFSDIYTNAEWSGVGNTTWSYKEKDSSKKHRVSLAGAHSVYMTGEKYGYFVLQDEDKTITIPENFTLDITPTFHQSGTIDSENRPKNINVFWSVMVGIPKIRTDPKKFSFTGSSRKILLYKGESGQYMGKSDSMTLAS